MNILYIDHYAGSLEYGMEFRPYYFAREWKKLNHTVTIVAADYSHLRIQNPEISSDFASQTIDGIPYIWIHTNKYQGNGLKRAITMFQFAGKLWLHAAHLAKKTKPDVVISSSTHPLDTYPAQRIARAAGAKYIHESHDLWPLTLTTLGGMSEKHPFVRLLQCAENSAYKNSEAVVGVLPFSYEHMLDHGLSDAGRFHYIPNGFVSQDWKDSEPLPPEHRQVFYEARKNNQFILCYLGGHALSNALDTLLDAAKALHGQDFAFVLIGGGAEKQRLIERARQENISNLHFLPPVPKKAVPAALMEADALYIGLAPCPLYRYGVSLNKVYDYMISGKPIIQGVDAANNEVAEAQCGLTIKPGDSDALAEAVACLRSLSEEERSKMGLNGKHWCEENREYKKLAAAFLSVMNKEL